MEEQSQCEIIFKTRLRYTWSHKLYLISRHKKAKK